MSIVIGLAAAVHAVLFGVRLELVYLVIAVAYAALALVAHRVRKDLP